jgi:hypothetical protein
MKVLLIAYLLAASSFSAEIKLAWNPTTTYTSGLPVTSPVLYRLHYGDTVGIYPHFIETTATSMTIITDDGEGSCFFVVSAIVDGVESAISNSASTDKHLTM